MPMDRAAAGDGLIELPFMAEERASICLPGGVEIPLREIEFEFSRSGGPGGQNVNKVNSRATLRFDVARSPCLDDAVRATLLRELRSKLTGDGVLIIHAGKHREQARNRAAALGRFEKLLAAALSPRKKRHPTHPTRGSVERRLRRAKQRSEIKKWRRRPGPEE